MSDKKHLGIILLSSILMFTIAPAALSQATSTSQPTGNVASSVEDVRLIQMALKNRGYDPGEINGMLSTETLSAIRKFQTANNLPVTGKLDPKTQSALGVSLRNDNPPLHGTSGTTEYRDRMTQGADILQALTKSNDKKIPDELLRQAEAIAVIPNMIKGAFGIGGRYGKGMVSHRLSSGLWSAPAFISIGGGSFGAQLGVSSTDLVLVFTDDMALRSLDKGAGLKLGVDASVAAGPVGRAGEVGFTHDLSSAIYAYSRSKGLFAGVALDGAVIDIDQDANHKVYGASVDTPAILHNDTMGANADVRQFVETLNRAIPKKISGEY